MPSADVTFENGRKTGVAFARQGFVKAFPAQTRVACELGHAFGASDVAQGLGKECRIVPRLLQAGFKVLRHVLICLEVFSAIPFAKFEGVHQSFFELLRIKHFGAVDRSHGLTVLNGIHIVKPPF